MMPEKICKLIDRLRNLPKEDETVEFKLNNDEPFGIGQALSALSNSAKLAGRPCGYLVFGIDDTTHELTGTSIQFSRLKKGNEELENWLLRRLEPRPEMIVHETDCNNRHVVAVQISAAADRPVEFLDSDSNWTAHVRVGTYTKKLREYPEKARTIWVLGANPGFEMSLAKQGLNADDITALLDYPNYFRLASIPLPTNQTDIITGLRQANLICEDQERALAVTNLGAITFGRNLADFDLLRRKTLRIVSYDGNAKSVSSSVADRTFTTGYATSFAEMVSFIMDRVPLNEEIRRALREERKMYPEIAVRELLANALIHQDFSVAGSGPTVDIYGDRIEITNPGVPLVTVDRFIDTAPKSRNDRLADIMRIAKICENRGQGIDRALSEVEVYQLPAPRFETGVDFTRVILYALRPLNRMNIDDKVRACYQHCALRYVMGDFASNTSIRQRFGISDENRAIASRLIKEAVLAKKIKSVETAGGSKKLVRYVPYWA